MASDATTDISKRDFLYVATGAVGAVGTAAAVWPLIDQMNPDASVLALATVEVDISSLDVGGSLTITWRGQPIFIRHRTPAEIEAAVNTPMEDLKDPQADSARVKEGRAEWLIMVGICTHLGCVPLGQNEGDERGEYGGWFCPCHGSVYDTSGRIRKGPAPANLVVPAYEFLTDTLVKIG
ncbi:MAG TPA: ubiquinol-cytochrome c reductase iron-sulfur subunit [Devosia sp.]|nr:ubiquinol-cytochrome c reductase iron-sulfur subunit [Devosia sp.]